MNSPKSVAICQPHYLPWIGYFEMIDRVDSYVFLDDVQFIKREWKNRNKIRKSPDSLETKWLSVPIEKQSQNTSIMETKVSAHDDWKTNHLNAISNVYSKSPFFEEVFPRFEEFLLLEHDYY